MRKQKIIIAFLTALMLSSCGNSDQSQNTDIQGSAAETSSQTAEPEKPEPLYEMQDICTPAPKKTISGNFGKYLSNTY